MSSEPAIELRGVGKAYRVYRRPGDRVKEMVRPSRRYHDEFWALRDLNLSVRHGETVGVIGRNGSGKSTLLQLICGILQPTSGKLEVRGRIGALLELGAGFHPEFTGRENIWVNAAILGLKDEEIAARLGAIEAFAGIGEFMDQPVKHYSSGMYARLAFSVCAHVNADILVVDEALSVGDAAFQQKCMRWLYEFRRRGTLLFVSHDLAAVVKLCDRVLWLERGILRAEGSAKEVCRRYQATMSEESTEDSAGFRFGGRGWGDAPTAELITDPHAGAVEAADFDPDALEIGGAKIERAGLHAPDGTPLKVASGGEEVELRIDCRAERPLALPVVGFLLRDRLGQSLFGDSTYLTYRAAPRPFARDQAFSASFRFQLPYLPTGEYAMEMAIYEGTPDNHRMLARLRDAVFLPIQSAHSSAGLLNVVIRSTRLIVDDEAGTASVAAAREASSSVGATPSSR